MGSSTREAALLHPFARLALVGGLVLASFGTAGASSPDAPGDGMDADDILEWSFADGDVVVGIDGHYRVRADASSAIPAYRTPAPASRTETLGLDAGTSLAHRLRLDPYAVLWEVLDLHVQADVLDGGIAADTGDRRYLGFSDAPRRDDTRGLDVASTELRRAWLEWEAPFGLLRFGRQPSEWGLGVLANDGDGFESPFGDELLGDTYDRVLFGTKPISIFRALVLGEEVSGDDDPLSLGFAYDFGVERDAISKDGDALDQYIVALLLEWDDASAGVYAVRREQEHADTLRPVALTPDPGFLDVWVVDTSGEIALPGVLPWAGVTLELAWEVAYAFGETNVVASPAISTPDEPFPVFDVRQWGGVVRLGGAWDGGRLRLEVGHASGDANRLDDEVTDFRLHPDYNVGLILFEDLLASVTAAQTFNLVNQLGEGGPVPLLGADFLASNGSVTNATYVFPTLWLEPTPALELRFGVLWARAAEDLVDPFNDIVLGSGGAGEINFLGGDATKRDLGIEIDLGVHWTAWSQPGAELRLGLEYGHLFPGEAFTDGRGRRIDDLDKVRALLTLEL